MVATYAADAAIVAYQRLIELNFGLWKPEVADWLHSEDAKPVLKELLVYVPCSNTIH
jgi:hypothetical protein